MGVEPSRAQRSVRAFVAGLAVAAAAGLAFHVAALVRDPPALGPGGLALLVASTLGYAVFLAVGPAVYWKGQRTRVSFEESMLLLVALFLPLGLFAPLVACTAAAHYAARRPDIKGFFNAACLTFAASVAAATIAGLVSQGIPLVAAAVLGVALFCVLTWLMVSVVIALSTGDSPASVARGLFVVHVGFNVPVALSFGLAAYGLAVLHPVALLAVIPIGFLVYGYTQLLSRTHGELRVRRVVTRMRDELSGSPDEGAIAAKVADATAEAFDCASAEVTVLREDGTSEQARRERSPGKRRPGRELSAPLVGSDDRPLGEVRVSPAPGVSFGEAEQELLKIVAAQAVSAIETSRSQRAVEAARQRAVVAEKLSALGTLVAGVAHEINNPLTYLSGNVELNAEDLREAMASEGLPEPARAAIEEVLRRDEAVLRGVRQIAEITRSLKTIARSGPERRTRADLDQIARRALAVASARFPASLRVEHDLRCRNPVHVEEGQIEQVLLNLLLNASQAMDGQPGSRLALRSFSVGSQAVVEIEDNGPGVPAEHAGRLFVPFHTTKPDGTGLGLSLSYGIVQAHGGKLEYSSRPGLTVFRVELPAAAPQAAPRSA